MIPRSSTIQNVSLAELVTEMGTAPPPHPDPVILSNALTAENISFFTFALILALTRSGGSMTLASLSRTVGHSYFAVRSQVVNTHYFEFGGKSPLVTVKLTEDAGTKLTRILNRITPQ